jgi:hypothetical protein
MEESFGMVRMRNSTEVRIVVRKSGSLANSTGIGRSENKAATTVGAISISVTVSGQAYDVETA